MKAKYTLMGQDEFYGIVWETDLGLILVLNSPNVNIQNGIKIYDIDTRKVIKEINTLEIFFKLLPCCTEDILNGINNVKEYSDISEALKDRFLD